MPFAPGPHEWETSNAARNWVRVYQPNMVAGTTEGEGTRGLESAGEGRNTTRVCGYEVRGGLGPFPALGTVAAPANVTASKDGITSDRGSLAALDTDHFLVTDPGTPGGTITIKCKDLEIIGNFHAGGEKTELSAAVLPNATELIVKDINIFPNVGTVQLGTNGLGNAADGTLTVTYTGRNVGAKKLTGCAGITADFGPDTVVKLTPDVTLTQNIATLTPRAFTGATTRFIEPLTTLRTPGGGSDWIDLNRLPTAGAFTRARAALTLGPITYTASWPGAQFNGNTGTKAGLTMRHIKGAQLKTAYADNNANLRFLAKDADFQSASMDDTTVELRATPGTNETKVSVVGQTILVELKTTAAGEIRVKAKDVKKKLDDSKTASALIMTQLLGNGDPFIPAAFPQTALSFNSCELLVMLKQLPDPTDPTKDKFTHDREGIVYLATSGAGSVDIDANLAETVVAAWKGNQTIIATVATPATRVPEAAISAFTGGTGGTLPIADGTDFAARMPSGGHVMVHALCLKFTGVNTAGGAGTHYLEGVEWAYYSNSLPFFFPDYDPASEDNSIKRRFGSATQVLGILPAILGSRYADKWGNQSYANVTGEPKNLLLVYPSNDGAMMTVTGVYNFRFKRSVIKFSSGYDTQKVYSECENYGRQYCTFHMHPGVEKGQSGTHLNHTHVHSCVNHNPLYMIENEYMPISRFDAGGAYVMSHTPISKGYVCRDCIVVGIQPQPAGFWMSLANTDGCGHRNNWYDLAAWSATGIPVPGDRKANVIDGKQGSLNVVEPPISDPDYNKWNDGTRVKSGEQPPNQFVESTNPADGAMGVAVAVSPVIAFNTDMDQASLTATNLELRDANLALVARTIESVGARTATINPNSNLTANAVYHIIIKGDPQDTGAGVKNSSGADMGFDHTASFITIASPAAPQIVSTDPANGASEIAKTTNVTVVFDIDMDTDTFTTSTIVLRTPGQETVPATVTATNARTAVLDPTFGLQDITQYTCTIVGGTNGVKSADPDNVPMPQDYQFSFSTLQEEVITPPGEIRGLLLLVSR